MGIFARALDAMKKIPAPSASGIPGFDDEWRKLMEGWGGAGGSGSSGVSGGTWVTTTSGYPQKIIPTPPPEPPLKKFRDDELILELLERGYGVHKPPTGT